jgi:hypothetical protein
MNMNDCLLALLPVPAQNTEQQTGFENVMKALK